MPQQINLSQPVLLTPKRYLSAQTMALALALLVLLGGGLTAYGVWSLNLATKAIRTTLDAQAPELASLRGAIADGRADAGTGAEALNKDLTARRAQLLERQNMLVELRRGLMAPGQGHSDRLRLVAQTIPAQAWITEMRADASRLELRGFTLEPAALNDWVAKLAQSPLMLGQQLAGVKVERANTPALWSFTLASVLPPAALPAAGGKP